MKCREIEAKNDNSNQKYCDKSKIACKRQEIHTDVIGSFIKRFLFLNLNKTYKVYEIYHGKIIVI